MENNPLNNMPSPRPPKKKLSRDENMRLHRLHSTNVPSANARTGTNQRPAAPGAKRPPGQLNVRRHQNAVPPPFAHGAAHIPKKHPAPRNIYGTYKLVGMIAVASVVLIIVLAALFSGGAPDAVPASVNGIDSTASVTTAAVTISETDALPADNGINVICVDPGHGYDDPGATCEQNIGDIPEKDVTLAVSLLLRDKLEEAGLTVVMTHSDDVIPTDADPDEQYLFNPFDRVDFVNAHPEVDLFVSLHCDAYTDDTTVGGTRVYYYDGGVGGTVDYAGTMSAALCKALSIDVQTIGKDYAEAYYVTKELSVPSILIEMGFITNVVDAEKLLSDEWRETFVSGTVQGILDYINSRA